MKYSIKLTFHPDRVYGKEEGARKPLTFEANYSKKEAVAWLQGSFRTYKMLNINEGNLVPNLVRMPYKPARRYPSKWCK